MPNDQVQLWTIEYKIGDYTYCAKLPATSSEHVQRMAAALGATATGGVADCEVSALSARSVMGFIEEVTYDPPKWLYNAEEQIESFLSRGAPVPPPSPE